MHGVSLPWQRTRLMRNVSKDASTRCMVDLIYVSTSFTTRAVFVADPLGDFLNLMQLLMGVQYAVTNPASLVKEAAQGHVDSVRRILSEHPTQVCCYQFHVFTF